MITQKQIAEHLNLSQSTVANILRGATEAKYSEETRRAVLEAAEKYGYQPSRSAQAIQRGRSNLIGIIHFAGKLEIAQRVSTALPQIISAFGYDYVLIDLRWHGGSVERVLKEIIQARVEGVIISHMIESFGPEYTDILSKAGIPVISVFGNNRLNIPVICDDIRSAFAAMTRHLLSLGHRRILMTSGISHVRPVIQRREGFELGMAGEAPVEVLDEPHFFSRLPGLFRDQPAAAVNLRIDMGRYGHTEAEAHYEIAKRLFATGDLPDAILCSNDHSAFGVFNAAFEQGIRIPDDLALAGSDDDDFGHYPMFQLTTVRKDIEYACKTAMEFLSQAIKSRTAIKSGHVFQSELVIRRSCGRLLKPGPPEEIVIDVDPIKLPSPLKK